MSVFCPHCEKMILNRANLYGTLCPYCFGYIKPISKLKIVDDNEQKLELAQKKILAYLRNKMLGVTDEYSNKQ